MIFVLEFDTNLKVTFFKPKGEVGKTGIRVGKFPNWIDDNGVSDETLTESGTLYRYLDPGFGFSTCYYVFETKDGNVYVLTRDTSILRKLSPEIDENEGLDLELTFRLTEKSQYEQCLHKREWLSDDKPYIWVESYRK